MNKYTVTLTDPANFLLISTIKWLRQIQGNSLESARDQAVVLRETRRIYIYAYESDTTFLREWMPDSIDIKLTQDETVSAVGESDDLVALANQVMQGNNEAALTLAQMVLDCKIGRFSSTFA